MPANRWDLLERAANLERGFCINSLLGYLYMFKRDLKLPSQETFFLWGPRQTGKSSLLREQYPDAFKIDLLQSENFALYAKTPGVLREQLAASPDTRFVVIDEIQKVPALLDEVHWLIEERGITFALCGSSARKLRRGHANLLGGRATRTVLHGLTAHEMGEEFQLIEVLNRGYLPRMATSEDYRKRWRAYIADYLKEEIAAEGIVRNLPAFANFLESAALSDTEVLAYKPFARDCGVAESTVKDYFQILEDTLLGFVLPAYTQRAKRRVMSTPKFYFFDVGLVNALARRGTIAERTELIGKAFENWVHHELRAFLDSTESDLPLFYWRLSTGVEVDFILGRAEIAIEAKASSTIGGEHLKGLREFAADHPECQRRIVVSLIARSRKTDDGIEILSVDAFRKLLATKQLLPQN